MYISFKLKDLQDKYTNLYPGDGVSEFPRCWELADRVAELLTAGGYKACVYEVSTNGLMWRVEVDGVSPEADLCVWVGDILSPREAARFRSFHMEGVEVLNFPVPAEFCYDRP